MVPKLKQSTQLKCPRFAPKVQYRVHPNKCPIFTISGIYFSTPFHDLRDIKVFNFIAVPKCPSLY